MFIPCSTSSLNIRSNPLKRLIPLVISYKFKSFHRFNSSDWIFSNCHSATSAGPNARSCFIVIESIAHRSEEHTSELQSRFDLVCRLLLEKKKKNHTINQ